MKYFNVLIFLFVAMQLLTGCKAEDENPAHLLQANAAFN